MVRHSFALALCAYGAVGFGGLSRREPGCGGADTPSNGPNAPCTRTKDCSAPLTCSEGVCTEPDAGTSIGGDGGASSGRDAAPDRDDGG